MLQRHAGEGETIAEAIRDCLDYGKNPEKTESGKYISAYECDPATVADEFLLAKASYAAMTGREQKKANDVLCYQIRQSFYPGEITPKEANRIGYELAMRWTKGRHAFIVTTHTDKQHIHCHIYYNSTTLDCTRKFRNFWGSSFALRRLSDRLCLENGLSIVENPKPRSKGKYRNYGEWQKERKGPLSYQDRLRLAIDTALAERPADLDEFLGLMKRAGYEVKKVRGGGISFRLTGQGQERFTRLRASTLGDGYDLKDVLAAIEGKEKRPGRPERKISLAVDIQAKLAAGKGPGYERWAKVFNIKQMAAALAYIQDNNLTDYEQLAKKATEAADRFHVISEQVKQTEQAMKTNAGLKAATVEKNGQPLEKNRTYYEVYSLPRTETPPEDYTQVSFVCLRPDGAYEAPATVSSVCRYSRKKIGDMDDFHFHLLRHTYTTNLLSHGAAPKDVQELLGHSDVSTTMNIYAHATREAKRTSARLLDKVVGTA